MRAQGQILTSSASKVPISATAYTEPTSGAQRSFKSSSVNDAAAGTGARKVKVTYYNLVTNTDGSQTITGPFNETVALNGTTAVATVSTTIALLFPPVRVASRMERSRSTSTTRAAVERSRHWPLATRQRTSGFTTSRRIGNAK